ncbi:hypothetical protein J21TS7_02960 [Paenibacillus cineris]|uniref:Permease n=1 Tax=Paenibacillus cineris TaxID=237530 RepID=A0ABQ4L6G3_9BACL|nr:hypothetical protein J21TS7_02960 [Paenibacillus cineris]
MHKKKYFTLLPPFLLLAIILAFTLPDDKKSFALLAMIAFWITYYVWIYIEKLIEKKND